MTGDALTDVETDVAMRIVHVDSNAAAGGDGTFENPYNLLADADGAGSMEFDKILVHSGSVFNGADGQFAAQANQDVFGEGVDVDGNTVVHVVDTVERGLVNLPETAVGASMGATPVINGSGDVFTLDENNEINNFEINGGARAVVGVGATAPRLGNLVISDTTGDSIYLENIVDAAVIENTVMIDNAMGAAIFIDGGEDNISSGATITDSQGRVMVVQNRLGGSVTQTGAISDTADVDNGDSLGILLAGNFDTDITFTGAVELDSGNNIAVEILGNNGDSGAGDETNISFSDLVATAENANTVDIQGGGTVNISSSSTPASITNTGSGDAVHIEGDTVVAENNAVVTIGADIENSMGGNVVEIRDRSANNVTISGSVVGGASGGEGILIEGNSDGTIAFTGDVDITTTGFNSLTMTNNEGATVTFNDVMLSANGANAVDVVGGGTLTITDPNGTNEIMAVNSGVAVFNQGNANGDATISIDAAVSSDGSARSVEIRDRTSNDVTFNGTVLDEGDGILIEDNSGGSIIFTDTVTTDTGNDNGIEMNNNTGTLLSFNGLDITTTSGTGFLATGVWDLLVTSPSGTNTIETTTGTALNLNGMSIDSGNATFDSVTVNGATNGILLTDLDGTGQLRIGGGANAGDGGTLTTTGTAISVNNVDDLLVTNVTVNNADAEGLNVTGQDGGTATFTGLDVTTTGNANAVTVENNTGGTIAFNDLNTSTEDGVGIDLTNNTGATITFNGMSVTASGTGAGFSASGGGTLTATGTNTVSTQSGNGVDIDGLTIGGAGASFSSVSVDGAAIGVRLNDLNGSQVTIGSSGSASTLANTSSIDGAIQVTNVQNVDLVNIDVTGATGVGLNVDHDNTTAMDIRVDDLTVDDAGSGGIDTDHTGDGTFTMFVDNSTIDDAVDFNFNGEGDVEFTFEDSEVDSSGTDVAFALLIDTFVENADITIRRNDNIDAENASAFNMNIQSASSKTVNFLFDDNTLTNSSADVTAEIDALQATILNATITDNSFSNAGAGEDFDIASNDATTVINMHLNNNTAAGGAGDYTLRQLNLSTFNIQERDTVESRNNGNFTYDSAGNVLTDFGDIISVPLP